MDTGRWKRQVLLFTIMVFLVSGIFPIPVSAEKKIIRVGYMDFQNFIYEEPDGTYSGYGVEYLEKIANYTDWEYEYVFDTWENQLKNLESGKIDLICHAQKTPDREEEYVFSQYDVGSESSILYVQSDDERYYFNDFEKFDGMRVALLKGSMQNQDFADYARQHGFSYTSREYDTQEECFAALDKNEVDGVAIGMLECRTDYRAVARFGTNPLYFMAQKENQDLMNEMNNALGQILISNPTFGTDLYTSYYGMKNTARTIAFTREEKDYIEQSGAIPVAFLPNRSPYSYTDENGEPQGITVDVLKLLEEKSGLEFRYDFLPTGMWAVDYLENHPDSLVAGVQVDNPQFLTEEYLVSDKILTADIALAGKKGEKYNPDDSQSNYTLAISKSYVALQTYIENNYKQFKIILCQDSRECLLKVQKGEADFAAQNIDVMTPLLQDPHYDDLAVIPTFFMEEHSGIVCCDGQDRQLLMNILNKCIASLTENELSQITVKHTINNGYEMNWKDVLYKYRYFLSTIVLLLVLVFALMYILSVQRNRSMIRIQEKNKQLSDAVLQADHANQAKSRFLAHMSHEIRTPLNAIVGLTTIARYHKEETEKTEEYLDKIEQSSKMLLNIVNDVLDLSAIESEKLQLNHASFNIKEILKNVAAIYTPQCRQKGVRFQLSITGIIHERLVGDGMRLNQILLNLVSNAFKFTPRGGTIKLTVREVERRDKQAFFRIVVEDNGEGISKQAQERLFEPFEQEKGDTSAQYSGSGLGLSITKNLLEMMHGTISCKSEKGKGTSFQIAIPIEIDSQEEHEQDYRNIQALVVDDDKDTREYMSILLDRIGMAYTIARSGEMAMDILEETKEKQGRFDICFVDWKLSDVTGAVVSKKIRELFSKDTTIVIASACNVEEIQKEATAAGADLILTKPVFQSTIFNLLTKLYREKCIKSGPAKGHYDFGGKRVLLAEDTQLNAEITTELLQMVNVQVVHAVNGKEVLELFLQSEPGTYEAILMDIQMPEMDGYEATQAIRSSAHPEARTIPIFAITANAFTEDVSKALNAGMNGHIAKPIEIEVLYATLYKAVKKNEYLRKDRE